MARTRGAMLALATAAFAAALLPVIPARAGSPRVVTVRLSEWHVAPKPRTVRSGTVRFVVKNIGAIEHELVIVRGASAEALPTQPDGAVDETLIPEQDKVGNVENIRPEHTKTTTFALTPGKYILFCNLVDKDDPATVGGFSHFQERMYSTITSRRPS